MEAAKGDPAKLMNIGSYAEKWGAFYVADEAYAAAIAADRTMRAAYAARRQLAHARGQTTLERATLAEMIRQWPDDVQAKRDEAYLSLLLDSSVAQARAAAQHVSSLALEQPADWIARATLALARLRQDERTASLAAFSGDRGTMDPQARPGDNVPTGAQAVFAASLAATGWTIEAQAVARKAAEKPLLPQERKLIGHLLEPDTSR